MNRSDAVFGTPEAVEAELLRILDAFDVEPPEADDDSLDAVKKAITEGLVTLNDGAAPTLTYTLRRPVASQTSGEIVLAEVVLHEPNALELKQINKGTKVQVEGKTGSMDLGEGTQKTINGIVAIGKKANGETIPLGLVGRILNRDMKVLAKLIDFFG